MALPATAPTCRPFRHRLDARIRTASLQCHSYSYEPTISSAPIGTGRRFFLTSNRGGSLRPCCARGVEFAVALLDSASPLVPGNSDADMVWTNPFSCGGNFLLCLARCQGKDLIAEAWRTAIDAS